MKRLMLFAGLFLLATAAWGFIPRGLLILQKTSDNSGSGTYQIEQEVQFQTAQDPFVLKETWWVDNDSTLRLQVVGTREYKDLIRMNFIYTAGQKHWLNGPLRQSKRLTEDFIEKYFHFRSGEAFANALIEMKIVPGTILLKHSIRPGKESEYTPESFLRLSRSGGVINYAFGSPSEPTATEDSPGLWIEQDQFVIRKLRLPSGAEVAAERYSQYPRGLLFPRKRSVRWENNLVQIQTLSVSAKPSSNRPAAGTLEPTKTDGLESVPIKSVVEEFYKRFR